MKIPIFPNKYHQYGGCSMAMLVSGSVYIYYFTNLDFPEIAGDFPPNLRYLLGEIGRVSGRYNLTRYMYRF